MSSTIGARKIWFWNRSWIFFFLVIVVSHSTLSGDTGYELIGELLSYFAFFVASVGRYIGYVLQPRVYRQ